MNQRIYTNTSLSNPLFSFCLLLAFTIFSFSAKACVDPDTIATLTVNYSDDFSDIEIRIGNLKLETEAPNSFCACGLSSVTEVFTYVTYIAMVYEGTNDVYPNFVPFTQTSPADMAWDGSQPALPDWNGYVAEVINGGLVADEGVEMIIRAEAPPGVLVTVSGDPQNDTSAFFFQTWLGTDKWDPGTMDLVEAHQAIRTFAFMDGITQNVQPTDYFDDLDATVGITSVKPAVQFGKLSPNPARDYFELSFNLEESTDLSLVIYDITGKVVYQNATQTYQAGRHFIPITLTGILPESGMYIASVKSDTGQSNFKFIKQ